MKSQNLMLYECCVATYKLLAKPSYNPNLFSEPMDKSDKNGEKEDGYVGLNGLVLWYDLQLLKHYQ